jgi:hypothetical protein
MEKPNVLNATERDHFLWKAKNENAHFAKGTGRGFAVRFQMVRKQRVATTAG